VLQGMGRRGQGQDGQAGEPPDAEVTTTEHFADSSPPFCPVKPMRCPPCLRESPLGDFQQTKCLPARVKRQASVLVTHNPFPRSLGGITPFRRALG
jgi:hypothetical protein